MSHRTGISSNLSPTDIELEENQQTNYNNDKNETEKKKKKRFNSPMRNPFKSKRNNNNDDDDDVPFYRLKPSKSPYSDLQFQELPSKVPVQAIILASVLFVVGSVMIILGALLLTGYIKTEHADRSWPLILIGSLVFLPGFYHVRIAYWAWQGDKNFSYEDIPDLD